MSKLSKTLWMAAAAALGAGVTYYALKKDEVDFEGFANDVWESTKKFSDDVAEDFEKHFNEAEETAPNTSNTALLTPPTSSD